MNEKNWLSIEEIPDIPVIKTIEYWRELYMANHWPRLWQAFEQLETQPIDMANVTEGRHDDKGTGA